MGLRLSATILITWLTISAVSAGAAIIGYDGRMLMQVGASESYSVGLLMNTAHSCSVTMVSRRLGLTNRHCFLASDDGAILPDLRGKLVRSRSPNHGYIRRGSKLGPTVAIGVFSLQATAFYEIRKIWWGPSGAPEDDWAVLLLDGSPGDQFQTFQLANTSRVDSVQLLSHAGYSEIFFLVQKRGHTQHDCHMIGRTGAIFQHDCANSKGASGGPLWLSGTNQVIGLNSFQTCPKEFASSDEACSKHGISNGAVSVEQFRGVVDVLMAEGN